jgi:hypothetical protein
MTIRAKVPRKSTKSTAKRKGLMPWRVAEWQTDLLLTQKLWMLNLSTTCSSLLALSVFAVCSAGPLSSPMV